MQKIITGTLSGVYMLAGFSQRPGCGRNCKAVGEAEQALMYAVARSPGSTGWHLILKNNKGR